MEDSRPPDVMSASGWIAAAAIVVLCLFAASSGTTRLWENPGPAGTPTVRDPVTQVPEDEPSQAVVGTIDWPDLSWLFDAVNVLALMLLAFAIVLVITDRGDWRWRIHRRTRRRFTSGMSEPLPDIGSGAVEIDVVAATEALAVGTPRNAIVRCWMQLERDASAVGLARQDSETAAEYVERVIASSSVDPGPIVELASLYREARFSRHELDDAQRAKARRALKGVAAQLLDGTRRSA